MIEATAQSHKQESRVLKQIRKPSAARRRVLLSHGKRVRYDYLDLLEARAVNEGKGTYTASQVKARLGLK
jgi:hypothetical protein